MFKRGLSLILFLTMPLFLSHCGSATSVGNPDTGSSNSEGFPDGLAIASPTSNSSASSNLSKLFVGKQLSSYEAETAVIDAIINGTTISDCAFDLSGLTTTITDASCYGPQVAYENHPDGSPDNSPLPTGDLGMWTSTNEGGSESCAAAQINSRMEGIKDQTTSAMSAMASMICTLNVNGTTLATGDYTTEMNNMSTSNSLGYTFNTASLTLGTDGDGNTTYTYALDITATLGTESREIEINMTHIPLDSTNSTYKGRFNYNFVADSIGSNCPESESTEAGSVLYHLSSSTDMKVEARQSALCGTTPANFFVDGILDESNEYDATTNSDGWANSFDILTANFDPSTNAGTYAYSWQAGAQDDAARVFNIALTADESTGLLSGTAYAGYGDDISNYGTDGVAGVLVGTYCNWAGPNGAAFVSGDKSSKLTEKVQRQTITEDSSTGVFGVDTSNLTYAPTVSCDHDESANPTFNWDQDADGTIDTITADVTNNLVDLTAVSFTQPTAPENF